MASITKWYSVIATSGGPSPQLYGFFSILTTSSSQGTIQNFYLYSNTNTNILSSSSTNLLFNYNPQTTPSFNGVIINNYTQSGYSSNLRQNIGTGNAIWIYTGLDGGGSLDTIYGDVIYTITLIDNPFDSTVCFKIGTKILTNNGYMPIQNLKKGDLVKTVKHDYVAINMIGHKEIHHCASKERIKDQLYVCSKKMYPELFEDLIITGCHCILVDSFIDAEQRQHTIDINGDTFVTDNKYRLPACADYRADVYEKEGSYMVYHFALEHDDYYMNYGVFANGLLVETCSKRNLKELSNMTIDS